MCGDTLDGWVNNPTVELDTVTFQPTNGDEVATESPLDLVDKQLAQYHIDKFLGQGGMARVYLATHLTLERPCAIKVLRPITIERDEGAIDSFLAEARSAAALSHPHVVTLHTIGHDAGRHFIEMEYVDGRCLSRLLEQSGPLDPTEATRFMLQVCSALEAAHGLGMIHRDIKPANVMVTQSGVAKLADFGLAKRLATKAAASGILCGTPNYMAPELFAGQAASKASDVYAMGVTYFSLLTGRLPVETQSINELIKFHKTNAMTDVETIADEIPVQVARVLRKALMPEATERYVDAIELHDALREVFGQLRSLRSLLNEAFPEQPFEIRGDDDRFVMRVPLSGGRFQTVRVESLSDDEVGEHVVRVFSVCGPSTDEYYERALHLNSIVSHGAIAIEDVDGEPHFVMVNAYPRATCDAEEIRRSVWEIARHSDEVEHRLTGEDRH
jgi:serine/threonine-protein kinase